MIDHETIALDAELSVENQLRQSIARLEHTLKREREKSAEFKASARLWEARAKRAKNEILVEIGRQLINEGESK